MSQKKSSWGSCAMLSFTALIWGIAFVAQREGMNYVGEFTFNACRFLVGGIVVLPYLVFLRRGPGSKEADESISPKRIRLAVIGGICCGAFLFVASTLQQFGIGLTTVGKAGFITSLYIIIVPVLGLLAGKKMGAKLWLSVAIAAAGMYLLCITQGFFISTGDLLVIFCAIGFSFHILVIDYFSPKADGVLISCIQFFTAGVISLILAFCFEQPKGADILAAWAPILYAGVMSCGVGYTFQVVAQKKVEPVIASLILSLESVFSVLAGWILLEQRLSSRELFGCGLVFGAIVLAQWPGKGVWQKGSRV